MRPRILLFDWTEGGHHLRYLRRTAAALVRDAEIAVAAPDASLALISDLPIVPVPLGASRPALDLGRPLSCQHAALAGAELDLFAETIAITRPDHAFHLYSDPILRWIVRRPPFATRISLLVFFARWHYPAAFGDPMPARERLRAWFQRSLLERWRRRSDAHALFLLDPEATRRLGAPAGAAPAFWFPEPPTSQPLVRLSTASRSGAVMFGQMAARKGIELAADAMALLGDARLVLAGCVEAEYRERLALIVAEMRRRGVEIDLRDWPHSEEEGLSVLARARVALLPYPRHYGMSRVLLEAASVGTSIVAHHRGLIAHLVREHGLGEAVDCHDPRAFAAAVRRALEAHNPEMEDRLIRFGLFHAGIFQRAVRRGFESPLTGRLWQDESTGRAGKRAMSLAEDGVQAARPRPATGGRA